MTTAEMRATGIRILKFPIPVAREVGLPAVVNRWLGVGWQEETLVVWAEATPTDQSTIETHLVVAMTGDPVPRSRPGMRTEHIGTAMHPTLKDGAPFVAHVYQVWP